MISGALAKLAGYAAAVLAVLGLIWKVLADARGRGRQDAELDALRRSGANRETRDAIEDAVARQPGAADRLRKDWTRNPRV
jgi:hypothetical protein